MNVALDSSTGYILWGRLRISATSSQRARWFIVLFNTR